jgi:hypothetical protein
MSWGPRSIPVCVGFVSLACTTRTCTGGGVGGRGILWWVLVERNRILPACRRLVLTRQTHIKWWDAGIGVRDAKWAQHLHSVATSVASSVRELGHVVVCQVELFIASVDQATTRNRLSTARRSLPLVPLDDESGRDDDELLQEHGDDGPIRRAPKVGDGEVVVELAFSLAAGNGRSGSRRLLCSLCKTCPP